MAAEAAAEARKSRLFLRSVAWAAPTLPDDRSRADQINQYFNTAAFAADPIGQFGNLGRNTLIGPGFSNTDLGLLKNFAITERVRLQFRGESVQRIQSGELQQPGKRPDCREFQARLSSAQAARGVQFALKLSF